MEDVQVSLSAVTGALHSAPSVSPAHSHISPMKEMLRCGKTKNKIGRIREKHWHVDFQQYEPHVPMPGAINKVPVADRGAIGRIGGSVW